MAFVAATVVSLGVGAAVASYFCLRVAFPTYLARELKLPSKSTIYGDMDVVLAGGRGGGCDSRLIGPTDTLETMQKELWSWAKDKPSALCVIRALGDRGETDAIATLLDYALAVQYSEVPIVSATVAAALNDIGGPSVRKTALAFTTSDDPRLLLIGVLVLIPTATARDRAYLWSLRDDLHFRATDRDQLVTHNLWAAYNVWGMGLEQCGLYGCQEGWLKAEPPVPFTADD